MGVRAGGAGTRRSRTVPCLLPPRLRVHWLPPAGAETLECRPHDWGMMSSHGQTVSGHT